MGSQYEGRQDEIKDLNLPKIETFKNQYPDRDYDVTIVTGKGELSSCSVLKQVYRTLLL